MRFKVKKKHELMNALAGSVTEEKNILNKVNILFSFLSKSVLVASLNSD